ncbi:Nucleoside-diphosphate-sugar epimerase [Geosporobacter subterraneus DSM 17957]|uniref:Nucleoside-diphosphate-sugar epimerase n=1 Tax=Geosporobacter subterraneus DSM 17957 TaxID=1121919 RepID=A0A1M6PPS7_9FIRM|nr:L-threonine 3-dehydrogenase [Geosporobacter subterraneus]SHK09848.1 Nucleoside-diphosphate-sugar epimerase [Geosporobacter subterraneus DSM 17957]
MKKVLVTGALGQIGSELVLEMRKIYGDKNIIASSRSVEDNPKVMESGPFELVDVLEPQQIADAVNKHNVDTVIHLAAILSAVGEANPALAWKINVEGLFHVLEVAREKNLSVFTPSSIAAFGPSTPKDQTPQDTLQRPNTMYGVTKVSGELLCDYYYEKFGVDTRGVRFPGLISYETLPGGGTTDYAVHIYYEALKNGKYTCYLKEDTYMDMMYMPDALQAIIQLAEADPSRLRHRNAFNVTAMSFSPKEIGEEIKKHIPGFTMDYQVDPIRQKIADSWPNSLDDQAAREEWGWKPKYDLGAMTQDMLEKLRNKLNIK